MTMAKRPRRSTARRDMFGASANKHMVGQSKQVQTNWRRDVHLYSISLANPQTGTRAVDQLVGVPGAGFTRQLRRVALHGAIAVATNSVDVQNTCGVLEIVMGLAESNAAFQAVMDDSEAAGMFRRYVSFAQGAGVFKFWMPTGWNQQGQGDPTPAGGAMAIYFGARASVISPIPSGAYLRCYGLISTQEKEERVYS